MSWMGSDSLSGGEQNYSCLPSNYKGVKEKIQLMGCQRIQLTKIRWA